MKSVGSTYELLHILEDWRMLEDAGIFGGAVKCVDIKKNTKGEGRHLEHF